MFLCVRVCVLTLSPHLGQHMSPKEEMFLLHVTRLCRWILLLLYSCMEELFQLHVTRLCRWILLLLYSCMEELFPLLVTRLCCLILLVLFSCMEELYPPHVTRLRRWMLLFLYSCVEKTSLNEHFCVAKLLFWYSSLRNQNLRYGHSLTGKLSHCI